MRVVLAGGTGFLGSHLARRLLERGDEVTVLTRGPAGSGPGWRSLTWDPPAPGPWEDAFDGADAVVHLTGKRVDCRATRSNLSALISSRIEPVHAVGRAVTRASSPLPVWVQLSSLAIYGDAGEEVIDERSPLPDDGPSQMVEVCRRWEAAFAEASAGVQRRVLLRPSIVLGGGGDPATRRLVWLARRGLGGRVGSGRQWVSWIALDDMLAVLLRALDDESMSGAYHATAPEPVRNAEMMAVYRRLAGRSLGLASPALLTRAGAWLMGSDGTLALTGRRGVPTRLLEEGFVFSTTSFADAARRAVEALRVSP